MLDQKKQRFCSKLCGISCDSPSWTTIHRWRNKFTIGPVLITHLCARADQQHICENQSPLDPRQQAQHQHQTQRDQHHCEPAGPSLPLHKLLIHLTRHAPLSSRVTPCFFIHSSLYVGVPSAAFSSRTLARSYLQVGGKEKKPQLQSLCRRLDSCRHHQLSTVNHRSSAAEAQEGNKSSSLMFLIKSNS